MRHSEAPLGTGRHGEAQRQSWTHRGAVHGEACSRRSPHSPHNSHSSYPHLMARITLTHTALTVHIASIAHIALSKPSNGPRTDLTDLTAHIASWLQSRFRPRGRTLSFTVPHRASLCITASLCLTASQCLSQCLTVPSHCRPRGLTAPSTPQDRCSASHASRTLYHALHTRLMLVPHASAKLQHGTPCLS